MMSEPRADLLAAFRGLPAAEPLLEWLQTADGVYLVGGAVRDLMLDDPPLDLDFVVDGDLEAVLGVLAAPAAIHERFGTATVRLAGRSYDFAQARRETYPSPGALPEVSPAGPAEDLQRRDFTVNAMALDVGSPKPGLLLAVPGAAEDLRARRLRVLHDASFIDDPTRLLRLARYAARLSFEIEPHTLALARAAVATGALETVSGTRLGSELRLLAAEPRSLAAFGQLRRLGIDRALMPGFGLLDSALAGRALELLPPDGNRATLVLAAASIAAPAADLAAGLERWGFPAAQRDAIHSAATGAPSVARALERARRPSEIAAAVGDRPRPELVALAGALGPIQKAREWLESLRMVALEINGHDLVQAGVPAGAAIGAGLRAALAAKLDGRAEGREAELAEAIRIAGGSG
jgi:tRNA nucleotidyltransferase (CCA-adding enzyme)